jgi:hypothetical protein
MYFVGFVYYAIGNEFCEWRLEIGEVSNYKFVIV